MIQTHKMVVIKSIYDAEHDLITHIYALKGEILDVSYDEWTFTIHEDYERNGQMIPGIRGEFNDFVFDYFMHLADWREKRINEILNDNEI